MTSDTNKDKAGFVEEKKPQIILRLRVNRTKRGNDGKDWYRILHPDNYFEQGREEYNKDLPV